MEFAVTWPDAKKCYCFHTSLFILLKSTQRGALFLFYHNNLPTLTITELLQDHVLFFPLQQHLLMFLFSLMLQQSSHDLSNFIRKKKQLVPGFQQENFVPLSFFTPGNHCYRSAALNKPLAKIYMNIFPHRIFYQINYYTLFLSWSVSVSHTCACTSTIETKY